MAKRAWAVVAAAMLIAVAVWQLGSRRAPPDAAAPTAASGSRGGAATAVARQLPSWVGQGGRPGQRIAGMVTHAGAPVAAATVRLALESSVMAEVATGADGRFDLGVQPAMLFEVSAQAARLTPAGVKVDLRAPAPDAATLTLELTACTAVAYGAVRDAAGGVIPHAFVRVGPPALAVTEANERGEYELCVTPGEPIVAASADGYAEREARELVVRRRRLDFALEPEAVIVGQVLFLDSGAPAADAAVSLLTMRGGTAWTRSDADGRFRFAHLGEGPAYLSARLGALAGDRSVDHAAMGTSTVRLLLEPRGSVRGRVSADGQPVAGATVVVRGGGRARDGALTDAQGRFEVSHVRPKSVTIRVVGYVVLRPVVVDAAAGDEVLVEVRPRARIRGRVTIGGAPARFAEVSASLRGGGQLATAGADGGFEIGDLERGTYTVSADAADRSTLPARREVTVGDGEIADVALDLSPGAAVAGVIVDEQGAPLSGATVDLSRHRDLSGADGTFVVVGLAAGEHVVNVSLGDMRAPVRSPDGAGFPAVTVPAGVARVNGVRLVVRRDVRRITGSVLRGGVPVGGIPVGLRDGSGRRILASATAAADGSFEFSDVEVGQYLVTNHPDWDIPTATVAAEAGMSRVVLELPAEGAVEGELVGFGEPPFVVLRAGDRRPPVVADVDGTHFRVAEIAVGQYHIDADAQVASARGEVTVRAGETTRVTLTSSGTARLRGRLIDVRDGTPAAGVDCEWPRIMAGEGIVVPDEISDASGRFELEIPAARDVDIRCSRFLFVHERATVRVAAGARGELELRGVRRRQENSWRFGCDIGLRPESAGARVERVGNPGAGLRAGDLVVAIDGTPTAGLGSKVSQAVLCDRPPGSKARITVVRDGEESALEATPVSGAL